MWGEVLLSLILGRGKWRCAASGYEGNDALYSTPSEAVARLWLALNKKVRQLSRFNCAASRHGRAPSHRRDHEVLWREQAMADFRQAWDDQQSIFPAATDTTNEREYY